MKHRDITISKVVSIVIIITRVLLTENLAQNTLPELQIHYLGHSSFVLQFDNGIAIVTDYGHENAWKEWGWDSPIYSIGDLVPDVMTFSHKHDDHYDVERIPEGVKHILMDRDSLEIEGIIIKPIRVCEKELGNPDNTAFLFIYKGLNILHLGDAQKEIQSIDNEEVREHISKIIPGSLDLLFMTIEGPEKFIAEAEAFVDNLKPKRIIPMHYWSTQYKLDFIAFCEKQDDADKDYVVEMHDDAEYSLNASDKVKQVRIISLEAEDYILK